ncbi:hypothetical protein [Bifidobacterium crudilactis]|uniref:hypothetical protein n=1 Tax=Bifidobacterium crudilactis TaxID=327277 RepID=UPI002357CEF9|nr:hypothetical protein [Bifidobacterium crudilactis]
MRIRNIKPEFWRSDDIASLDVFERLLFVGLWSYVDDNGVGRYHLIDICADLFAQDLAGDPRETLRRLSEGLGVLAERGLIQMYEADGGKYIYITNWERHQKVHNPNKPRYPRPSNDSQPMLFDSPETLGISTETLGTGSGGQRDRGTEGQSKNIPAKQVSRSPAYSDDFEIFWKTYPSFRRKEKPKAWAEWKKAINRAPVGQIISGLQAYLTGDVTYAPYPAKWLKLDSWNDGPDISQRMQSSRIVTRTQKAQAEWDEDRRIRAEIQAEEQRGGGRLALTD